MRNRRRRREYRHDFENNSFQLRSFLESSDQYTFVTWDYRGLFSSDKPANPRRLSIREHGSRLTVRIQFAISPRDPPPSQLKMLSKFSRPQGSLRYHPFLSITVSRLHFVSLHFISFHHPGGGRDGGTQHGRAGDA